MAKSNTATAPVVVAPKATEEQDDFILEETTIDEIPAMTRASENVDRVAKWATRLLPGKAFKMNPEKMKYGTLTAVIRRMKKAGTLAEDYKAEHRADGSFWFGRDNAPQPVKEAK